MLYLHALARVKNMIMIDLYGSAAYVYIYILAASRLLGV